MIGQATMNSIGLNLRHGALLAKKKQADTAIRSASDQRNTLPGKRPEIKFDGQLQLSSNGKRSQHLKRSQRANKKTGRCRSFYYATDISLAFQP